MAVALGEQKRKKEAMDNLVAEIASGSEENITASIRVAIERGWAPALVDSLEESKRKKEGEIDKICSKHYSDFLKSVRELLQMRGSAANLKSLVLNINDEFSSTAVDLVNILGDLEDIERERNGTNRILEAALYCREIVSLMLQAKEQIASDDHYGAIRTLEALQREHKRLSKSENMATNVKPMMQRLHNWLPTAVNSLLDSARQEAETFLAFSQNGAVLVGSTILKRQALICSAPSAAIALDALAATTSVSQEVDHELGEEDEEEGSYREEEDKEDEGEEEEFYDQDEEEYCDEDGKYGDDGQNNFDDDDDDDDFEDVSAYREHIAERKQQQQQRQRRKTQQQVKKTVSSKKNAVVAFIEGGNNSRSSSSSRAAVRGAATSRRSIPVKTVSLRYIEKYGGIFRLDQWSQQRDFDIVIPQSFSEGPTAEGIAIVEGLAGQLGALHKALHMYSVLGETDNFHNFYRETRLPVLKRLIEQSEQSAKSLGMPKSVALLFANITGFFALECVFRHCSTLPKDGAFSWSELTLRWDDTCAKIDRFFGKTSSLFASPEEVLVVKEEILLLCEAFNDEAFGLRTHALYEIMRSLWGKFEELQLAALTQRCGAIVDGSTYQPMYVTTEEEFATLVKAFRLDSLQYGDADKNSSSSTGTDSGAGAGGLTARAAMGTGADKARAAIFMGAAAANLDALEEDLAIGAVSSTGTGASPLTPEIQSTAMTGGDKESPILTGGRAAPSFVAQTFPFSSTIPLISRELHLMVVRFFIFAAKNPHLGSKGKAICNAVAKAYEGIGNLFKRELLKNGPDTPLSKACQISIDTTTLALASDTIWLILENALTHFNWGESIATHLPTALAAGRSSLMGVAMQSQDLIFELLGDKVDGLLESLMFIDYEPKVLPRTGHDLVEQVVDFLQVTFMGLTHLPKVAREAAHFTCCTRVNNGILEHILSPKVHAINALALIAFENDVKRLEQFANSYQEIEHLRHCFAGLKDLVKAALHPDLVEMADNPTLRKSLFARLDPMRLVALLEKVPPTPASGLTANLGPKVVPAMEKAVVRSIIKKLKKG